VPTAALVGAFAGLTGLLRIESVEATIRVRFPARTARHTVASARAAYRLARAARKERSHA
jgi:pyruvate ferredoxin oxidoreductase gamma subunit